MKSTNLLTSYDHFHGHPSRFLWSHGPFWWPTAISGFRPLAPPGVSPPRRSEALRCTTAAMTAMRRWRLGDNFWVKSPGNKALYEPLVWKVVGGLKVVGGKSNMFFLIFIFRNLGKMNPFWWAYVSNGLKSATRFVWWFCYAQSWIIYTPVI